MKQIIVALLVVVTIVSLVIITSTFIQVSQEEQRLKSDLQYRSTILSQELKETIEPYFITKSSQQLQSLVDNLNSRERFNGLAIYDRSGNGVATSSGDMAKKSEVQKIATGVLEANKAKGDFVATDDGSIYVLAVPMHDDAGIIGSLAVVQESGYIDNRLNEVWRNNLIRLLIQASLLAFAVFLLIRWIIYEPVRLLVETLKLTRMGRMENYPKGLTSSFFFRPLVREISKIRSSLAEARVSASEEARLRLEKLDSPWTAQRLKEFIKDILKGRTIYMVSNREPYIHTKNGGQIEYYFPASGMVTALEPVMQACGGVWIAYGSGDADQLVVDNDNKVKVPPDEPKYTLRRIWLTEEEEAGYYYGFSNEGLWPLCHIAHNRPIFRKEDWEEYKKVNQKFADAILAEIRNQDRPIVLVQDFHLSLVPKMIKMQRPEAIIGIFWHIPWPNPESFSICPWKKEILDGMLGADLLGFHTQLHCNNFIDTVGKELESLIDLERFTVTRNNHTSYVKPFPISISFPNGFEKPSGPLDKEAVKATLGIKTKYIGLGVDRLDYTKGIMERLKSIEIFLHKYPTYQGNFTFIQVAAPSRTKVKKYREFAVEVEKEVERINDLFKTNDWGPIILLEKHHNHTEIQQFYRLADFCLVTSLHDGMNLVAKEFAAARDDEQGVLILSEYTGASKELKDALIINPYNGEQTAEAIKVALEMPPKEQAKRMVGMREIIKNNNIYRWSAELLKTIVNIE